MHYGVVRILILITKTSCQTYVLAIVVVGNREEGTETAYRPDAQQAKIW